MKKAHFLIALISFIQSLLFANNYEETVQEMSHAITDLPSKGYLFVDLGLSAKDLALISHDLNGFYQIIFESHS